MPLEWTTFAGLGAVGAVIATTWRQIILILRRVGDLVVCRVALKDEAAKALMTFVWETGRRSPFGLRVFGAARAYVNPMRRVEVVGYESISSDPLLFWFGGRPVLIGRHRYGDNPLNTGGNNEANVYLWFVRRMFDAEALINQAIEKYNGLHRAAPLESGRPLRRRFTIRRVGRSITSGNAYGNEAAAKTPVPHEPLNEVEEQIKTKSIRLLRWQPNDIGLKQEGDSAFEGFAFPPAILEALNEIRIWLKYEAWFRAKGVPWRRGWLLHGPPGTGKSTLVRSIALEFDLPVHVLDLNSMDNSALTDAWQEIQQNAPAIALIEDVDAVFNGRENIGRVTTMRDALTFDCLLNTISGVGSGEGVFLFVTTNNLAALDPALGVPQNGSSTRPGRIDRVLELGPMAEAERQALATHILSDAAEFIAKTVTAGQGETAAQFQNRCAQLALQSFWKNQLTTNQP